MLTTDGILFDVLTSDPGSPVEGQLWFNTTDKMLKLYRATGGTTAVQAKSNITTTGPLVTSDSTAGYSIGSRWLNTSANEEFVCCDATASAAVWKSTTANTGASSALVQTASASISTDTSTTSTSWTDLLTCNITTGAGFLIAMADVSFGCSSSGSRRMGMRVTLDGVAMGASSVASFSTATGAPMALVDRDAVSAGAHVVKVQWLVQSGYTAYCRPVVRPDDEHGKLVVLEVTA